MTIRQTIKTTPGFLRVRGLLLVIPGRFELPTYRLGGGCSIQLSYGTSPTRRQYCLFAGAKVHIILRISKFLSIECKEKMNNA